MCSFALCLTAATTTAACAAVLQLLLPLWQPGENSRCVQGCLQSLQVQPAMYSTCNLLYIAVCTCNGNATLCAIADTKRQGGLVSVSGSAAAAPAAAAAAPALQRHPWKLLPCVAAALLVGVARLGGAAACSPCML